LKGVVEGRSALLRLVVQAEEQVSLHVLRDTLTVPSLTQIHLVSLPATSLYEHISKLRWSQSLPD